MFKVLILSLLLHSLPSLANERIVLTPDNTIVFRGEVSGRSITTAQLDIAKQVLKRGAKTYPLYLVLDSPGGSIEAGFAFVQFAKLVPNLHTISIFAASMASAIAQELPGDRLVTENGIMMYHKAAAGIEGTVETGTMESQLYIIKRRVLLLEQANASRMNMSLDNYKALIANELWLDAGDSLRYRSADKVVDIECSSALMKQRSTQTFASFFGVFKVEFSSCPLFRMPLGQSDDRVQYVFGPNAVKQLLKKELK